MAVLYASAYGNTASLAQAISHGITKAGVGVETLNLEAAGLEELEGVLNRCSGFVLGSPTLGGHIPTQVQTALGTIISNANARQVPCSVFGSFGWSGEAVDKMEKRLKVRGLCLTRVEPGVAGSRWGRQITSPARVATHPHPTPSDPHRMAASASRSTPSAASSSPRRRRCRCARRAGWTWRRR